jgi:hypothetical protein
MSEIQLKNTQASDNVLFEYVEKFCRDRTAYKVLYLNMHNLGANARSTANHRAVLSICQSIFRRGTGKVFELPNEDLALVFHQSTQDEVSLALVRIYFLLHDDEKVKRAATLEESGIAVFYNLLEDEPQLLKKISAANVMGAEKSAADRAVTPKTFFNSGNVHYHQKLTTDMLAKVQKIIAVSDFSSFIRCQSICAVIGKSAPQRVFEEVFVSIPDMRDSLLPEVDVTANQWLFLALTETLDKRVLEIISRHDDGSFSGNFSVNINVSTILSDDFLRFDDSINASMRQSIVLELQLVDIFSDIRSFILAKTFAKARGYKICIDGIMVDKLPYLNRTALDCDLMKLVWHPSLCDILNEDKHFTDYLNRAERAKIILCRVDDPSAIESGNALGINLYQGRYVQRLLNAANTRR